jgi:hypothetical protein
MSPQNQDRVSGSRGIVIGFEPARFAVPQSGQVGERYVARRAQPFSDQPPALAQVPGWQNSQRGERDQPCHQQAPHNAAQAGSGLGSLAENRTQPALPRFAPLPRLSWSKLGCRVLS